MSSGLKVEIDGLTAAREQADRLDPGCFWGDGDMTLTHAEAEVFGIRYDRFLRMQSVWDAWFEFLGLIVGGDRPFSSEAIEEERRLHPELLSGNEPSLFAIFAREVGGLTQREAEAMYWKDWFWTVKQGHVRYVDEGEALPFAAELRH